MNILLVYPEFPATFWSFKYAIEFVGKKSTNPPLGLITIGAMLPSAWQQKLIDMNVTTLTDADLEWSDLVLLSAMDVQRKSVNEVIQRCKKIGVKIVAGGPLFTGESESFPDIDCFILNEAEITLPLFLADLEKGTVKKKYSTSEYAEIQNTPNPKWDLLELKKYECMGIQFSRGCPFNCDFCNVTALLGHKPRVKTTAQIINELNSIYALGWRRNIFFVDDNFIGNKKYLKEEILPAIIEWRKGKTGLLFITEASINLADDDELLELMSKAGFISAFIGIETPDNNSLTECNKKQNIGRDLIQSIRKIQKAGIQVMAGFIVGFDNDPVDIFQKQIDFIQESGIVTSMVGILQAPYGTELYDRMQKENRLLSEMSGDNADGTTNIKLKMPSETMRTGYQYLVSSIYSRRLFYERVNNFLDVFQPRNHPVTLQASEISAFLKSIILIGVFSPERKEYWKLFWTTLIRRPKLFPLAITLTIYGYHFRKIFNGNFAKANRKIENTSRHSIPGKTLPNPKSI